MVDQDREERKASAECAVSNPFRVFEDRLLDLVAAGLWAHARSTDQGLPDFDHVSALQRSSLRARAAYVVVELKADEQVGSALLWHIVQMGPRGLT